MSTTEFIYSQIKNMDHDSFYFIQIGAADGVVNDPLYGLIKQFDWSGIMLEPQKKLFYDLKLNYYNRESKIELLNFALYDKVETRKLYKCKYRGTEMGQLSSLILRDSDKDNIYFDENYFELVKCVNFDFLIKKYKIKKIDLLLIDTEGYDFNIIQMFPFEMFQPKIIQFENWPHENDDKNNIIKDTGPIGLGKCINILEKYNYSINYIKTDIVAVKNE